MNLLRRYHNEDASRIFLHFINRELHDSLGIRPDPDAALRAIRLVTLFSDLPLCCNISQVYEFGYQHKGFVEEVIALSKAGVIELDCAFPSFDEFHDSRRTYYQHDFKRYPMYSVDGSNTIFSEARIQVSSQVASTTLGIQKRIASLTHEEDRGVAAVTPHERKTLISMGKEIRGVLENRDGAGLTFALFPARGIKFAAPVQAMPLRRALTASYVEHYKSELSAATLSEYPHLAYYEGGSKINEVCFNLEWLSQILRYSKLDEILKRMPSFGLDERIRLRHGQEHSLLIQRIMQLGAGLDSAFELTKLPLDQKKLWVRSITVQSQDYFSGLNSACALDDILIQLAQRVDKLGQVLGSRLVGFDLGWKRYEAIDMTSVLIMTATDKEDDVLFDVLKENKMHEIGKRTSSKNVYTEISLGFSKRLFHVRSSAGSIGNNSSLAVAADAIRNLNPKYIIAVGICFGLDEEKQKLGDVVVSRAVKLYEPGKYKETNGVTDFISRGDKVSASAALLDRANVVRREWTICSIHSGLVVSGEKLVNAEEFRSSLKALEPEAIAGEMEASGIVSVSMREAREWIVIKGIADWGKDKDDKRQHDASRNAIKFALKVIDLLPSGSL